MFEYYSVQPGIILRAGVLTAPSCTCTILYRLARRSQWRGTFAFERQSIAEALQVQYSTCCPPLYMHSTQYVALLSACIVLNMLPSSLPLLSPPPLLLSNA